MREFPEYSLRTIKKEKKRHQNVVVVVVVVVLAAMYLALTTYKTDSNSIKRAGSSRQRKNSIKMSGGGAGCVA